MHKKDSDQRLTGAKSIFPEKIFQANFRIFEILESMDSCIYDDISYHFQIKAFFIAWKTDTPSDRLIEFIVFRD
ncbi:hypothetical protein QUF76_05920 [Desulfobacterales bacterium HSG16]|nr:hypothetical protein [Desulfobacterales bacterium HSG16]